MKTKNVMYLILFLMICAFVFYMNQKKRESFVPIINRSIRPQLRNFRIFRDRNLEYVRDKLDKFGLGTLW
jgi:hypothetical protein